MIEQRRAKRTARQHEISEPVLDPELAVIDPHHHLWNRPDCQYLADEFLSDARSGHRIVATVFVECRSHYDVSASPELQSVGETAYAARVATQHTTDDLHLGAGIVGYADLRTGDRLEVVLDAHTAASAGRFCGVRQIAAWNGDTDVLATTTLKLFPGLLADCDFRAGLACLSARNLTYDAWIYHTQISDLLALLRACPSTRVVLDHMGTPIGVGRYAARRGETFSAWRQGIRELAQCPNLFVKVGGLGMPVVGFGFDRDIRPPSSEVLAEKWRPFVETVIESFGPNRCMLESNFPVDRATTSYVVLWNAFKRLTSQYSLGERAALFGGVAQSFYRLKGPESWSRPPAGQIPVRVV